MSRTDPQFKLRMPPALRARVEKSAKASRRSINAELVVRLQQSFDQGVPVDDSEPLPAPAARHGLRLLCLLVPSPSGESRSLPVHAMHRLPPYKGLSGRYYDGAHKGGVALFPFDVSGGTGFYLRETYARTPSPEVLARYSSRQKARAIYSDGKASAVGA